MSGPGPRVLHVLTLDLARGAQRYAVALQEGLRGQGDHRILTLFPPQDRALGEHVALDHPPTPLRRLGFDPWLAWRLRKRVLALDPALVVAHGSTPLKYLAAAPLDRPLVYYKIGIAHAGITHPLRFHLHRTAMRRATAIAGVSQECLDEVERRFDVPGPHVLIPNGRDPEVFHPRDDAPRDGAPVLMFVGHLSPTKRPELFIEVVRQLRARGHACRAVLVGDGPLQDGLTQAAKEAEVTLLGRRDDVPLLLRDADLFVFTSVPEGEGLPGVFIEAGLSGLPIVSTEVPGARTAIEDGVTGYVVPPDSPDALVERCARLLEDPALRRSFGERARAKCERELTLESSFARWSVLIARLLGGPEAAATA